MDRDHDMDHVHGPFHLRELLTTREAWPAAIYGDTIGGRSFTDEESRLLESAEKRNRPITACGWRRAWHSLTRWTLINCRLETDEEIAMFLAAQAEMDAQQAEMDAGSNNQRER
jgi:hypothetical protein